MKGASVHYFTEEQYRFARDEANALEYAIAHGYALVKSGNCYYMRDHDSMVFMPDGRWFWNSRGKRGRAIEFLMCYEGMTLPEAVLALCDGRVSGRAALPSLASQSIKVERKEFILPPASDSCKRLFGYLCSTRGLDREIVVGLVKAECLYESAVPFKKSNGETGTAHNAVFVGRDQCGRPKSAFQRGLSSFTEGTQFKRDVAGSSAEAPFCIPGREGVETVVVFEGAIDAISHASIYKLAGLDYQDCDRIALGGTQKGKGLLAYLNSHPKIKAVVIAFDEDDAGNEATEKLVKILADMPYEVSRLHQKGGKDWNDYLLLWRSTLERKQCAPPSGTAGRILFLSNGGAVFRTEWPTCVDKYKEDVFALLSRGERIVASLNYKLGV